MPKPKTDRDTRYFIDIDLKKMRVLGWGQGNRHQLIEEPPLGVHHRRLFLTQGQFHKLRADASKGGSA